MNLSRKWLSEFTDIRAADKEYADAMTMSGSKVEGWTYLGAEIIGVVVGRVDTIARHPDSDHLWVCAVDVGGGRSLTVVTGAQNVRAGDLVPVATDGSTLPGGKRINRGLFRGVMSDGMLCSIPELGLTPGDVPYAVEDGILILQEPCAPGQDIRTVLGFDDTVVEFEITSNRPDCLSVIGLARESAATFGTELRLHNPVVRGSGGDIAEHLDVEVEDPDLCPRYTARMVCDVKIGPSPRWMRERLRASGVRPINNIVDITNYVMLEYGQPMHAFDFACIAGKKIVVRRAHEGDEMTTLDGNKRPIAPGMLVIADEHRAVGIAGVMGGLNSEITAETKQVVFESANFNGTSIRQTAIALGMRTDASGRFEKGLDPLLTVPAVLRACELVELLGAAKVYDGMIDVVSYVPEPVRIKLEPAKCNALNGVEISREDMIRYLRPLGFTVDEDDMITVPSWRGDVAHYSDIAEEIARFYGYDRIPYTIMRGETLQGGFTPFQTFEAKLGALCRSLGYSEVNTYTFFGTSDYDKIRLPADSPFRKSVTIINPLGEDRSIMRTTAVPSMLETLARNYSYRNPSVKFFELCRVYIPVDGQPLPDERRQLMLGAYGGGVDFFAVKGAVETIFRALGIAGAAFRACSEITACHPGRCAVITAGGKHLGWVGQIHPSAAANYGMPVEVYVAELELAALFGSVGGEAKYTPLPRYPSMARDIALVCDAGLTAAELRACIEKAGGAHLRRAELFDVYTGAGIPEGKKSMAFSLLLRSDDCTLTDDAADREVAGILEALKKELGAVLR